jgi:signal transduction histidine kinase
MIVAQRRMAALQRAYTRGLLGAQEEERARVAREVHDEAVQRLAVLRYELRQLDPSGGELTPGQRRRLESLTVEVDELSDFLRAVAHRLHPSVIKQAGLVAALEQLAGEVTRTSGLAVTLEAPPDGLVLPPERSLALYRITQESLRNAVRHARARSARVRLGTEGEDAVLVVEDDGAGFDPASAAGGVGLLSIRERAQLAGGRVEVRSRPGAGTTVTVRVPRAPEAV